MAGRCILNRTSVHILFNIYELTHILYYSKVSYMKKDVASTEDLYQAILSLKDLEEAQAFFRDLLTEEEIQECSKRWLVARMLDQKVPYTVIQEKTGLSSTTVARISRWLKNSKDGYRLALDRNPSTVMHHTSPSRAKRRS